MQLSPAISRALALSLAVSVCGAVWAWVYEPLLQDISTGRDELQVLDRREHNTEALAAAEPLLGTALAKAQSTHPATDLYLEGSDPAVLAAELQRKIAELVASADAPMINSRTVPIGAENGNQRVSIEVDLSVNAKLLQIVLYAIETARPVLNVDKLDTAVPELGLSSEASDEQPRMTVHLRVTGYARSAA